MEVGKELWSSDGLGEVIYIVGSNPCYWIVFEGIEGAMEDRSVGRGFEDGGGLPECDTD